MDSAVPTTRVAASAMILHLMLDIGPPPHELRRIMRGGLARVLTNSFVFVDFSALCGYPIREAESDAL
jgi:hypothetical protein